MSQVQNRARRVALVTGASKGIGLATCKKLLAENFTVYAVAKDHSAVEISSDQHLIPIEFDLADVSRIPDLLNEIEAVDVLVNNVGIMHGAPYYDYTQEMRERIIALNIEAPLELVKALSETMIARQSGRIVNNAGLGRSYSEDANDLCQPDIWFSVCRASILQMTKCYAKLLGSHGVRVNVIAPGPSEETLRHFALLENLEKKPIANQPSPEEIAKTICWLAVEAPEYINGAQIDVTSGRVVPTH